MDDLYFKPYLAELYGAVPKERHFVYPRETMREEPVFPYYVLDGGAFFFACDSFGDAGSDTLLEKTLSGEMFRLVTDEKGQTDWGLSYHTTEKAGMPKRHEWQSWPQRLYMLLPLAQKFMQTGDRAYAAEWLRILKLWADNSPYETFRPDIAHTNTSMKWRDMQVSWRTETLIHSLYYLGTPESESPFTKEEWKYIYDFLDLNLSHLMLETTESFHKNRTGNHTLQMGSALCSAGVLMPELPRAYEYLCRGCEVVAFCHRATIFPDGGSREASPSYSHFIARLYLEAELHLERNGYPQIAGLHDSLIRQYQWLAAMSTREGRNLRFSDSYGMDAHADIRRMAKLLDFEPDFTKKSVLMGDTGIFMLRSGRFELAVDAMKFYGGHQHSGRIAPILNVQGENVLCDTGCVNYDLSDLYPWVMSEEAHSVVTAGFPFRGDKREVKLLSFDADNNTAKAEMSVTYGNKSYKWTRCFALTDSALSVDDYVSASGIMDFTGYWYLGSRATIIDRSYTARQILSCGTLELRSTQPLTLDRTPALDDFNRRTWLERLTWHHTGADFSVHTVLEVK